MVDHGNGSAARGVLQRRASTEYGWLVLAHGSQGIGAESECEGEENWVLGEGESSFCGGHGFGEAAAGEGERGALEESLSTEVGRSVGGVGGCGGSFEEGGGGQVEAVTEDLLGGVFHGGEEVERGCEVIAEDEAELMRVLCGQQGGSQGGELCGIADAARQEGDDQAMVALWQGRELCGEQ